MDASDGAAAVIGDDVVLGAGVVVGDDAEIGAGNRLRWPVRVATGATIPAGALLD
jgi:UDP-3-O-[3-hydroxymyristoyl] glucosamine N-acyltransferase